MEMHIGTASCLVVGNFTLFVALFFLIGKGKCARFISGFSTMPQEEREKYDQEKMSKDMYVLFLQLTLIGAMWRNLQPVGAKDCAPVWYIVDCSFFQRSTFR